tara:strand:+ start:13155 stop:13538 length:384 start_codon:yes stop_codon:yes gene_type:complete
MSDNKTIILDDDLIKVDFGNPEWVAKYVHSTDSESEELESKVMSKGSLSVGRGEKLPISKGAGLTAKGRAKYNRAHGSNLKAPAPHPKTEKDAARRRSFCARMKGVVKHAKGDAPRAKASLKRWNCH